MSTNQISSGIKGYMHHLAGILEQLDTGQLAQMVEVLHRAFVENKQIFTMGNGGHANTAAHMINEISECQYIFIDLC